jgi:hypothetical protein
VHNMLNKVSNNELNFPLVFTISVKYLKDVEVVEMIRSKTELE